MKIAIDSCSMILLAKASALEAFADNYSLFAASNAYKEVLKGKSKKFIDALLAEKLVKKNKIIVRKAKNTSVVKKLMNDFNIGIGEAETLTLVLDKRCDAVCTDNKQGRKTAVLNNLNLIGSIDAVVSLYKLKQIDKNKAIGALNGLKEFGWFHEYLIEKALEDVKNV